MKKGLFIFIALLLVISAAAQAQSKKQVISKLEESHATPLICRLFHTGTFKMTYMGK